MAGRDRYKLVNDKTLSINPIIRMNVHIHSIKVFKKIDYAVKSWLIKLNTNTDKLLNGE